MVLLSQAWVSRLGWTLLHFLWQGTVIAAAFAIVRAALAQTLSAPARYRLACAAMVAMVAAPLVTYAALSDSLARSNRQAIQVSLSALPYVVAAWLAGVAVFSIRLIGGCRLALQLRSAGVHVVPEEWLEAFSALMRRMAIAPRAKLLLSTLVETPMVVGWFRPVVLMPISALTGLPAEHVIALLAHELAHIRRNDYLVNILQSIAEAVLFYHPAVWWVSQEIRAEREACCDDLAVAVCGGDVGAYARALAGIEARRPSRLRLATAADGGSLVQRIGRLIGHPATISQMLPGPGAAVALLLLCVVGLAVVHRSPARQAIAPDSRTLLALPLQSARASLLFDPFFDPPPQAQPAAQRVPPHPQHGHRVTMDGAYLTPNEMPMTAEHQNVLQRIANLPAGIDKDIALARLFGPSQRDPENIGGFAMPAMTLAAPEPGLVLDTWVEDASRDYVESFQAANSSISRGAVSIGFLQSLTDNIRKVTASYEVRVDKQLPRPGMPQTYQISFGHRGERNPQLQVLTSSPDIMPGKYPAPVVVEDGASLALDLYRDRVTGQKLVVHIYFGELDKLNVRTQGFY